jgi:hypothetical protein
MNVEDLSPYQRAMGRIRRPAKVTTGRASVDVDGLHPCGGPIEEQYVPADVADRLLAACVDVLAYLEHGEGKAPNGFRLATATDALRTVIAGATK